VGVETGPKHLVMIYMTLYPTKEEVENQRGHECQENRRKNFPRILYLFPTPLATASISILGVLTRIKYPFGHGMLKWEK
jgi:hypothetical protein